MKKKYMEKVREIKKLNLNSSQSKKKEEWILLVKNLFLVLHRRTEKLCNNYAIAKTSESDVQNVLYVRTLRTCIRYDGAQQVKIQVIKFVVSHAKSLLIIYYLAAGSKYIVEILLLLRRLLTNYLTFWMSQFSKTY